MSTRRTKAPDSVAWMLGGKAPGPQRFTDGHTQTDAQGRKLSGAATHTGTDPLGRAIGPKEDHTKVKPVLDENGKRVVPKRDREGAARPDVATGPTPSDLFTPPAT